jgi:hypothetical protein
VRKTIKNNPARPQAKIIAIDFLDEKYMLAILHY